MAGDAIVCWTARLAVMCYAARLLCDAGKFDRGHNFLDARWWWTAGCVIFTIHVVSAFHFEHHWNHAQAYVYTAERTAAITGWNSGVGLYVNEAFLCLWIFDAVSWWWNPKWPEKRLIYWVTQSVFAFLMFQATAVFGPPLWKPLVALFVVAIWIQNRRAVGLARGLRAEDVQRVAD